MMAFIRRRIDTWLFRLGKAESGEVHLNQRRVFIMPSAAGCAFFGVLVLLFIGSINYTLSLGFGLTFLLASCAVIDMHLTWRNLAHLYLAAGRVQAVFTGEEARFELHLHNRSKHDRYAIWIGFLDQEKTYPPQAVDLAAHGSHTVTLGIATTQRGWLAAPRLRLQTRFPLGLLRAWSYWKPDMQALVYPQPEAVAPPLPLAGSVTRDGNGTAGEEDFAGVRAYQHGDTIKRLSWRHIARLDTHHDSPLVSKHFEGGAVSELTLDFAQMPSSLDTEQRLSRMTRWVLEAESQGLPYAFRLGATVFPAAIGAAHRDACLRALALYQLP
ncbi:MAG: DUF58 domain-containing protein [Proteobacteria bacterium]|nr:DUF58 domain-containing protein [Pseudomonadota bacterium]